MYAGIQAKSFQLKSMQIRVTFISQQKLLRYEPTRRRCACPDYKLMHSAPTESNLSWWATQQNWEIGMSALRLPSIGPVGMLGRVRWHFSHPTLPSSNWSISATAVSFGSLSQTGTTSISLRNIPTLPPLLKRDRQHHLLSASCLLCDDRVRKDCVAILSCCTQHQVSHLIDTPFLWHLGIGRVSWTTAVM